MAQSLDEIKAKIARMSHLVLKMWETAYGAFLEHDLELISDVLDDEERVNDMEKDISVALIEINRTSHDKKEKLAAAVYSEVIGDFELIGDYCKDILERVQIKIEEKLLFSIEAVKEYQELYRISEAALKEIVDALHRDDYSSLEKLLKTKRDADSLADDYRKKHIERLLDGTCNPRSGNMFLNMLEFGAWVYKHAMKIAADLHKLK